MTGGYRTTMRDREIGWRLRKAMRAAGLNGQDMAARMQVLPSRISRIAAGYRISTPIEVAVWLALCGITTGPARDDILALCDQDPNVVRLEGAQRWISLREHSSHARGVDEVAPTMVPWGLQTSAYTHALALGLATDFTQMCCESPVGAGRPEPEHPAA